jgi:hypothetical protein
MPRRYITGIAVVSIAALVATAAPTALKRGAPMRVQRRPLAEAVLQAERVIVGKVLEAGDPNETTMKLPDANKPVEGRFITYTVEVIQPIKPIPEKKIFGERGDIVPARPPEKIQVVANVPDRARPVAIGKAIGPGGAPIVIGGRARPAGLTEDGEYILCLRRLKAGDPRFYVPLTVPWRRPVNKHAIKEYQWAADVDDWPWGKAVRGLQLAIVKQDGARFSERRRAIPFVLPLALRNTGKDAITVRLENPADLFGVRATNKDGDSVTGRFSAIGVRRGERGRNDGDGESKKNKGDRKPLFITLKPGEVRVLSMQDEGYPGVARMALAPGKWKLRYSYMIAKMSKNVGDREFWAGGVTSGEVEVEVVESRKAKGRVVPGPAPKAK